MENLLLRCYLAVTGSIPTGTSPFAPSAVGQWSPTLRTGPRRLPGTSRFNQRAVHDGVASSTCSLKDLWDGHPCCAVGLPASFVKESRTRSPRASSGARRRDSARAEAGEPARRRRGDRARRLARQPVSVVEQVLTGRFADGLGNEHNVARARRPSRPSLALDGGVDPDAAQALGYVKQDLAYQGRRGAGFCDRRAQATGRARLPAPERTYARHRILGKVFDPAEENQKRVRFVCAREGAPRQVRTCPSRRCARPIFAAAVRLPTGAEAHGRPAYLLHRLHFGFTITFHYLFPQLTMGLAPLIVVLQTIGAAPQGPALRRGGALLGRKIFGLNFVDAAWLSGVPDGVSSSGTQLVAVLKGSPRPILRSEPEDLAQKRRTLALERQIYLAGAAPSSAAPRIQRGEPIVSCGKTGIVESDREAEVQAMGAGTQGRPWASAASGGETAAAKMGRSTRRDNVAGHVRTWRGAPSRGAHRFGTRFLVLPRRVEDASPRDSGVARTSSRAPGSRSSASRLRASVARNTCSATS